MKTTCPKEDSKSSSWIKLPGKEGMAMVNTFITKKNIDKELCKEAI